MVTHSPAGLAVEYELNEVMESVYHHGAAESAKAEGVPFLDVTNAIADQYDKLGEVKVKAWFPEDHTHTSPEGADFNASLVVAALKGINSPLAAFLSVKGQAVEKSR